jgi:hypothetical protein
MGLSHSPSIVTNGLVFALDAANIKSYNTATSTSTWYDLSGNSNNTSLTNSPTVSGGVMNFNGTNTYVTLPLSLTTTLNSSTWTFETWLKCASSGIAMSLLGPRGLTNGRECTVAAWAGVGFISFAEENIAVIANTFAPLANNEILHLAFTYGSGIISTYKNGVKLRTQVYAFTNPCASAYTLSDSNNTYSWNGWINNTKIYNRTLSDGEIIQNFNALRSRYSI